MITKVLILIKKQIYVHNRNVPRESHIYHTYRETLPNANTHERSRDALWLSLSVNRAVDTRDGGSLASSVCSIYIERERDSSMPLHKCSFIIGCLYIIVVFMTALARLSTCKGHRAVVFVVLYVVIRSVSCEEHIHAS